MRHVFNWVDRIFGYPSDDELKKEEMDVVIAS